MNRTDIRPSSKLEREIRSIERELKHERMARKTLIRHAEFFSELEQMSTRVFYSRSIGEVTAFPYLDVTGFTSEASPELADILCWLEETLTFDDCRDRPDMNEREYVYRGPGFKVILTASFSEADQCKRVVTGTRKATVSKFVEVEVDQPIYEFVC